jgi:hypothetical protein
MAAMVIFLCDLRSGFCDDDSGTGSEQFMNNDCQLLAVAHFFDGLLISFIWLSVRSVM